METNPVVNVQCCALRQISVNNIVTTADLKSKIRAARLGGWRCVFVITLACENLLVEKLIELDFNAIHQFPRRKQYDKTPLTMWVKNI